MRRSDYSPHLEAAYIPKLLRIEGCYQVSDIRPPLFPPVSRAVEGLSEGAFVHTCMSHHYKLTKEMWGSWCRIITSTAKDVMIRHPTGFLTNFATRRFQNQQFDRPQVVQGFHQLRLAACLGLLNGVQPAAEQRQ